MKFFDLFLIIKNSFLHESWSKKSEKQCIKIGNGTQSHQKWKVFSKYLPSFYNKILRFLHMHKKKETTKKFASNTKIF